MSLRTNNPRNIANKRSAGKRTVEQREADKVFCTDLFVKGYAYREIATKLNEHNRQKGLTYELSYKTIFMDINQVLIEWKKERFREVDNYIQVELRKLDKMEVELWEAWEKSKSGKRKTKIAGGKIEDGQIKGGDLDSRQLEDTNGDPRYLDLLLKVQERRAKLLGYNAPVKLDVCSIPPKEEAPAGAKYDANTLPIEMLVDIAYKLQEVEYKRRQEEAQNGKETDSTTE